MGSAGTGWTHWSLIFSTLGATQAILIAALATCVVFLAVTRRWRPVVFVAAVMLGELGMFLAAAAGLLFSALWLTAASVLIKPDSVPSDSARQLSGTGMTGSHRRPAV